METTSRKKPISVSSNTDKHLCQFLISPFRKSGFRAYKIRHGITSFPEPSKQISNRLSYLKTLYTTNLPKFANLCHSYEINSSATTNFSPDFAVSKQKTPPPQKMSISSSSSSGPFDQGLRKHQHRLNLTFPSMNTNGMMWFRDDDVMIGDDMCSILTIYQPLFDARDHNLISLRRDAEDPTVLHHIHPAVPTFLYRDYESVHIMDESTSNPDIFTETQRKHRKHAYKIMNNENLKLETTEIQLPFGLSTEPFDQIENSNAEIMKTLRTILIKVDDEEGIVHTCSFLFWKIMIDGETIHCSDKMKKEKKNAFVDAHKRMSSAFQNLNTVDDDSDGMH
jgi:hypothetical protein